MHYYQYIAPSGELSIGPLAPDGWQEGSLCLVSYTGPKFRGLWVGIALVLFLIGCARTEPVNKVTARYPIPHILGKQLIDPDPGMSVQDWAIARTRPWHTPWRYDMHIPRYTCSDPPKTLFYLLEVDERDMVIL